MVRAVFALLFLLLGALTGWGVATFDLTSPPSVVREPSRPEESRLDYQAPDPPQFPLEVVGSNPFLLSLMNPTLTRINSRVYLATGYSLGNVALIVASEGLIIVDTTESQDSAREVLAQFRTISALPIRMVIYTHGHLDHVMGSSVFASPGIEVVASSHLPDYTAFQFKLLEQFQLRARITQAGLLFQEFTFPLPIDRHPVRGFGTYADLVYPTRLIRQETDLTVGDVTLKVFPTEGETPDHLAIWLPQDKVLLVGDLFYQSFPNLCSPMLESRPVLGWISSLNRFLEFPAEALLPGHTGAVTGAAHVASTLKNYRDAVQHVHDQTVHFINEGKDVEEAVEAIRLPAELSSLPYLQEQYGRVSWSVRGLYRGYQGWYDGNGSHLNPLPSRYLARELVALAGGVDQVLSRAIQKQQAGEHQIAVEIADLVIQSNPDEDIARHIKATSLRNLAFSLNNINNFGFYRSAFAREMAAISGKSSPPTRP